MPEVLRILIENWAKQQGCSCYNLQSGYLNKEDLQDGFLNLKNAVFFVYNFACNGIITDTEKLINKNLLTVTSNNIFVQYHKIVDITDGGTIQRANSDFVFKLDSGVNFSLQEGPGAMFQKIYNASLKYVAVQQECTCN